MLPFIFDINPTNLYMKLELISVFSHFLDEKPNPGLCEIQTTTLYNAILANMSHFRHDHNVQKKEQ